jgi:hypothetical protein
MELSNFLDRPAEDVVHIGFQAPEVREGELTSVAMLIAREEFVAGHHVLSQVRDLVSEWS